jgi:multidrug efflux pump
MNISAPFIRRPVATTLLTAGLAVAGILAFFQLPVAPLPQIDFPTISVKADLPGSSPNAVATSLANPLERRIGQIAGVRELVSYNIQGEAKIVVQFDLTRNLDGAARDVLSAINAARIDLPSDLRLNPIYRKVNRSDFPIVILALTSNALSQGRLFDLASTVLQQRISQIEGVGDVAVGGSSPPGVRVELNPHALARYGIGLEDVRAALATANADSPKGAIEQSGRHYEIYTNDQANHAADYRSLIVAYRNGAPVWLTDVGEVVDSVQDIRNAGLANGKEAVMVVVFRQPGANIIDTVDRIKAELPRLRAAMPSDMDILIASDRSNTIRASLHDTELALVIAVLLVTVVVFLFLGDIRTTLIPSVAVVVSILGTFGVMYLFGYSLDNLSLIALTISTGFVIDDAVVVVENITRHLETGISRTQAALRGVAEVGFTVLSISISLVAVFIPILFMTAILGRMFREFAVTLSVAILISLVISLTTTPMMCAALIRLGRAPRPSVFAWLLRGYQRSLDWALRHGALVMLVLVLTVCLNVALVLLIPKGFFPQQDTGNLLGTLQADQSISFQFMRQKLVQATRIVQQDPAVQNVVGFTGAGSGGIGGATNQALVFISLKPLSERHDTADQIIARLRQRLSHLPGARLYLQAVQDLRIGGSSSKAQWRYILQSDGSEDLYDWTDRLVKELQHSSVLIDVNSDTQQSGLKTDLTIDRATAARLGLSMSQVDNTLYDAFGQRLVSTIYSDINQYHVVMEVAPKYWQSPEMLKDIYISTSAATPSGTATTNAPIGTVTASAINLGHGSRSTISTATTNNSAANTYINAIATTANGTTSAGAAVSTARENMIPLAAIAHFGPTRAPISVNRHGQSLASTISFNLQPGASLSDASAEIDRAVAKIDMPDTIRSHLQGTARAFEQSLRTQPKLIIVALIAIYIVLGILYESFIHPITILSTLPSAGVGAVAALLIFKTEFSVMALIGIILLIGIVKKNAILMIDFAIHAKRSRNLSAHDAILEACLLRFRPILMTTLAAMFGAVPLALTFGNGSEIRQPLGIAIIGGLMLSQILTLYTTPVIYVYLDRLSKTKVDRRFRRASHASFGPQEL